MKFLDLCAGIGGFSLGLEWAGMTCAGQVEIDPFCIRILEKHWPHVPRWKDIKNEHEYSEYPAVDLVCGGYPCQPFSHAGKRRGAEDDRHLWPYVFKIVQRLRPAWCCFENVVGHVTLGLDAVLADLEGEGYACRALVIPACSVGAWRPRSRVWIVAYLDGDRKQQPQRSGRKEWRRASDFSGAFADVHRPGLQAPRAIEARTNWREKGGMLTPSAWWAAEPGVVRVVHGLPGRMDRISALGRAVVPELVMQIGLALQAARHEKGEE